MPTIFTYKHKVVTPYGEMFLKTEEAANDMGLDSWIKENQKSINAAFGDKTNGSPVKITAIYLVKGDGSEVKL